MSDDDKSIEDLTKEWADASERAGNARRSLDHVRNSLPYREREYENAADAEQAAWLALSEARKDEMSGR